MAYRVIPDFIFRHKVIEVSRLYSVVTIGRFRKHERILTNSSEILFKKKDSIKRGISNTLISKIDLCIYINDEKRNEKHAIYRCTSEILHF